MRWPDGSDHRKISTFINRAYNNGVNYFEACMFYNNWNCEKILSNTLTSYSRDSYFLCDKMPIHGVLEKEKDPKRIFESQLVSCQTDYFDYYLIQAADRLSWDCIQETGLIEYLDQEKQNGRIRKLGFSFHDDETWLQKYLDLYSWDCVQLQLNYVDWHINNHLKLYNIVSSRNIPIFVMGALKGGHLTHNLPKEAISLLHNLDPVTSIASWGMRFIGGLPGVQIVLTGTTDMDELLDNINVFSDPTKLILDDYSIYSKISDIYARHAYIPCTECKYCEVHCPNDISISKMFTLYNQLITDYSNEKKNEYNNIIKDISHGKKGCMHCGKCIQHCPQKINIPKTMNDLGIQYR